MSEMAKLGMAQCNVCLGWFNAETLKASEHEHNKGKLVCEYGFRCNAYCTLTQVQEEENKTADQGKPTDLQVAGYGYHEEGCECDACVYWEDVQSEAKDAAWEAQFLDDKSGPECERVYWQTLFG